MSYPGAWSTPNPHDLSSRLASLERDAYHILRRLDDDRRAREKEQGEIHAELKELWDGIERQNRIREAIVRRGQGYLIYGLGILVAVLASGYFSENSPAHVLLKLIGLL